MNTLKDIVNITEAEGFEGAHSLIFLIRYAKLADDRKLMTLIENTMEGMTSLPADENLLAAYKEYYRATGSGADAVKFLEGKVGQKEELLPWDCLELYRESFEPELLERAIKGGEFILEHFHEMFNPSDVYDIEAPSFNSRVAVLFDELARYTGDEKFVEARKKQNKFIRLLADKYPGKVNYGLCALLAEEFGETTLLCRGSIPEAVRSFYSPTTAIIFEPSGEESISILKNGEFVELKV